MEVVHVDLPIFSSPTEAYGYFGGNIEVPSRPQPNEPFPWPQAWLSKHDDLFRTQCNQVWGISQWERLPSDVHITMFGIVCDGKQEAESLVRQIESESGILFSKHEPHGDSLP